MGYEELITLVASVEIFQGKGCFGVLSETSSETHNHVDVRSQGDPAPVGSDARVPGSSQEKRQHFVIRFCHIT
jgi:hypothetical protein